MKIKVGVVLLIIVSALFISCSARKNTFLEDKVLENGIKCSLQLNQDSFLVGDRVTLYFVIENGTEEPIYTSNISASGNYLRTQESEYYNLAIHDDSGDVVQPDPYIISMPSGRWGIVRIDSKNKLKVRIDRLSKYSLTDRVGSYNIQIDKQFYVYARKKEGKVKAGFISRSYESYVKMRHKETILLQVLKHSNK